jgi:hypothetical protein
LAAVGVWGFGVQSFEVGIVVGDIPAVEGLDGGRPAVATGCGRVGEVVGCHRSWMAKDNWWAEKEVEILR